MKNYNDISPTDLNQILDKLVLILESNTCYQNFRSEILSLYQPVSLQRKPVWNLEVCGLNSNRDKEVMAILLKFMHPFLQVLIQVQLEEEAWRNRNSFLLYLLDTQSFKNFLLISPEWNLRKLKGAFSKKSVESFLERIRIKYTFEPTQAPEKVQRHKGYRDKGTLPEFDKKVRDIETKNEILFSFYQHQREERITNFQVTVLTDLAFLRESYFYHSEDENRFYYQEKEKNYENERTFRKQDCENGGGNLSTKRKTRTSELTNFLKGREIGSTEVSTCFNQKRL